MILRLECDTWRGIVRNEPFERRIEVARAMQGRGMKSRAIFAALAIGVVLLGGLQGAAMARMVLWSAMRAAC
jgi:hypothetical protein